MQAAKACGKDVHHGPFDPWNVAAGQPTDLVVCALCGDVLRLAASDYHEPVSGCDRCGRRMPSNRLLLNQETGELTCQPCGGW